MAKFCTSQCQDGVKVLVRALKEALERAHQEGFYQVFRRKILQKSEIKPDVALMSLKARQIIRIWQKPSFLLDLEKTRVKLFRPQFHSSPFDYTY